MASLFDSTDVHLKSKSTARIVLKFAHIGCSFPSIFTKPAIERECGEDAFQVNFHSPDVSFGTKPPGITWEGMVVGVSAGP